MKIITFLAVCVVGFTAMFSCKQNEYSCDPDVEEWTKTHLEEFQAAEREKIVSLPLKRQMAVYNGLTPEAKSKLWKSKLAILMNDDSFANDEKVLFTLLSDIVTPRLFDESSDNVKLIDDYEALSRRIFEGKQDKYAYALCTWMTEDEYQRSWIAEEPVLTKINGGEVEPEIACVCRHDIGCLASGGGNCNNQLECTSKEKGCGFLGKYSCDGLCE